MGTFCGHVLPGTFILTMSLFWAVSVLKYHFKCVSRRIHSKSSDVILFNVHNAHNKSLQGATMVALTSVGLVGEFFTGFDQNGTFKMENLQHISIYGFYFFMRLCQLLEAFSSSLPMRTDYFAMSMAFLGNVLILAFHLHGQTHLEAHLHILVIIATASAAISCPIELAFKSSPLAALLRPFFAFVMGTWLIQIAFILYNPIPGYSKWVDHDHNDIALATAIFSWHIFGACLFFGFLCRTVSIGKKVSQYISKPSYQPLLTELP